MKVSELAKKLAKLDQSLEVYCYEEGPVPIPSAYPGPFDIGDVSEARVESSRDKDGKAVMKFSSDQKSRAVAIIGITSDF